MYDISYNKKIALGGLKDTDVYNSKSAQEKKSIDDAVKIELNGKDSNNLTKMQKRTNGGC